MAFRMLALVAAVCLSGPYSQVPQPCGAGVEPGMLPAKRIHGGPKRMEETEWQIHEYNANMYTRRESGCTHTEKPFLYVVFGEGEVKLIDTGAGQQQIGRVYDELVAN